MNLEQLEVTNNNLADEYSNAGGCGIPPVCSLTKIETGTKRTCKTILGKEVCVNVPTVKTVPNQACINNKKKYNECNDKLKEMGVKGVNKVNHLINLSNPLFSLGRTAYAGLVNTNAFGWATLLDRMKNNPDQTYWNKLRGIWYNLGGDIRGGILDINIEKGKNKKPVFLTKKGKAKLNGFGGESYYGTDGGVSEGVTVAVAVIGALAGVVSAFVKANPKAAPQPSENEEGYTQPTLTPEQQSEVNKVTQGVSGDDIDVESEVDSDKILGIPKTGFYVGLTVLVLVGGYIGYRKFIAKK